MPGRQRLLNDLEGGAAGDEEDVSRKRAAGPARKRRPTTLSTALCRPDVLAAGQELAREREDAGRVESAGLGEGRLRPAQCRRAGAETSAASTAGGGVDRREVAVDRLDRALAAETAGRARQQQPPRAIERAPGGRGRARRSRRCPLPRASGSRRQCSMPDDLLGPPDDALGEEPARPPGRNRGPGVRIVTARVSPPTRISRGSSTVTRSSRGAASPASYRTMRLAADGRVSMGRRIRSMRALRTSAGGPGMPRFTPRSRPTC